MMPCRHMAAVAINGLITITITMHMCNSLNYEVPSTRSTVLYHVKIPTSRYEYAVLVDDTSVCDNKS